MSDLQFFVDEDGQRRGPLSLAELRAEVEGKASPPKVRADGSTTWLPAFAWEPLADICAPPSTPPLPKGGPGTRLPPDIADIPPSVRERLRWFVVDRDGVMGPVAGEFVRQGLASGRIPVAASVCLASRPGWVRASVVFPRAVDGVTALRLQAPPTIPCPYCKEPLLGNDRGCSSCGERVRRPSPNGVALAIAGGAYVALALIAVLVAVTLRVGGVRIGIGAAAPASSNNDPSAASSVVGAASATAATGVTTAAAGENDASARAGGHITGEIAATFDVASDAIDAVPLDADRIAVVRRSALDVVDAKKGVVATSMTDLAGLRALVPLGSVVYALGPRRITVLETASLRVLKTIDAVGPAALASADASPVAVAPLADQTVTILDRARNAEIDRFRFDDRLGAAAVGEGGHVAILTVGDPRAPRPGEDAVLVFDPSRFASAQPILRVFVGDGATAAAIAPSGTHAAVALGRADEVVRVELATKDGAPFSSAREKTCDDPIALSFVGGALVVACRRAGMLALHDAATLAPKEKLELGGAIVSFDVAADKRQVLVSLAPPKPGVVVVDVAEKAVKRIAIDDDVADLRYASDGRSAAAVGRSHKVWVLR